MSSPALVSHLIAAAAETFSCTPNQVVSGCRISQIKKARHIAMYLARIETRATYAAIAEAFGLLDHSTARAAIIRMGRLADSDPHWRVVVEEVLTRALELQEAAVRARAAPSPA